MNINQSKLEEALEKATSKYRELIGHNDSLFLQRIYGEGLNKYIERLRAIGFTNHGYVLDAGCGFGQWSLALAQLNHSVSACDISNLRINVIDEIVKTIDVPNLNLRTSGIDSLPYADASFDAVFCYSVIMMTPWKKSLSEFWRVLKPGGVLYLNANDLGWYMYLWQKEPNKAADYDPKALVAQSFADTLRYERDGAYENGMNMIIDSNHIKTELENLNFNNIRIAEEGMLHEDGVSFPFNKFLLGNYCGALACYELLAIKTSVAV